MSHVASTSAIMKGSENCETPEAPQPGPFVLAIKVQIKPELRDEWLQQWKVLAKHVREKEPKTLAYEVSEVEGQENTFLVYERYCTKADLHDPHQQSEPFRSFKQWCTETDPYVGKEGYGAFETKIGFMSK